jgi:hypothetical protein
MEHIFFAEFTVRKNYMIFPHEVNMGLYSAVLIRVSIWGIQIWGRD